jgi:hypothetical protein
VRWILYEIKFVIYCKILSKNSEFSISEKIESPIEILYLARLNTGSIRLPRVEGCGSAKAYHKSLAHKRSPFTRIWLIRTADRNRG